MNDTQKQEQQQQQQPNKQQQGQDAGQPAQTPDELIGDLPPDAIQSDANDNSVVADLPDEGRAKPGPKGGQQGG